MRKIHRKYTIKDMQKIAKSRGGKCLSKEYKNTTTKLQWECSNGHRWWANSGNTKRGHWCPFCVKSLYEEITRYIFETLANKKFLTNNEVLGNKQQLDGYNSELKLAFEYDGEHHYKEMKHFNKRSSTLLQQKEKDALKNKKCKKMGIDLIRVPYTEKNNLVSYISLQLKKRGYKNNCLKSTSIDLTSDFWKTYSSRHSEYFIKRCKLAAKKRRGKCLSKKYFSAHSKLKWECKRKHRWETNWNNIQTGNWCPYCAGTRKKTIEDMQKLAKQKHGKCLSKKYINSTTRLRWQCEKKHQWKTPPSSVICGSWCPYCAGVAKKAIKDMHVLAKQNNGECLSKRYTNDSTKLLWRCEKKHKWKTTPGAVKQGQWCPICAIKKRSEKRKGTIEKMQALTREKNGKCLSQVYINSSTKLKWQCSEGHKWKARPNNIQRGQWCPECSLKQVWETRRKNGIKKKLKVLT